MLPEKQSLCRKGSVPRGRICRCYTVFQTNQLNSMKTKPLLLAVAFFFTGTLLRAQFSNTYHSGTSQNHSNFLIEQVGNSSDVLVNYIAVSTSYANTGMLSPTNGIRITGLDYFGNPVWDRRYTNLSDIHALDITLDPFNGTFLITGYVKLGALNRLFVARVTSNGAVTGMYYVNTGTFNNYHLHGTSVVAFNGGNVAVTGVATALPPTSGNIPFQTNQMFLAILTPTLGHINTTFFAHQSLSLNNYQDVPLHIIDLPRVSQLFITGAAQSNLPGRREAVMNMYFDYSGNFVNELSFMDLSSQRAEIGQYSYYDPFYDLIFLLSYKVNSGMTGVYAVDPYSGSVVAASEFLDPNGLIATMYGLSLNKDNINSPQELFISGYIPDNRLYDPNTMPMFTVSMSIPDLIGGNTGFPVLFAYPDPDNSGYRFFNFSDNMFSSSNPVLDIPTHLGFSPQMAILDNSLNIVMASPRLSQMFDGYHPNVSQNIYYYWQACTNDILTVQYQRSSYNYISRISNLNYSSQTALNLPGATNLPTGVYPCFQFFAPNGENDGTNEEIENNEDTENILGTEDPSVTGFRVYPTVVNESSADLMLELTDVSEHELTITIYDAAGRRIFQQNATTFAGDNRITVKAENLAKGLNILHVTGLDKPLVTKILRN